MKLVSKDFMNWFAGFWEGEGTFNLSQPKRRVEFAISQKRREPLEYIIRILGVGKIYLARDGIYPLFRWYVNDRKGAIEIARRILPFLTFRKNNVAETLKIIEEWQQNSNRNRWTKKEDDFIRRNYKSMTDKEIAKPLMNRTTNEVKCRRKRLKLHKPLSFLNDLKRRRSSTRHERVIKGSRQSVHNNSQSVLVANMASLRTQMDIHRKHLLPEPTATTGRKC